MSNPYSAKFFSINIFKVIITIRYLFYFGVAVCIKKMQYLKGWIERLMKMVISIGIKELRRY